MSKAAEIDCGKCGQTWLVTGASPRLIEVLAKLTGYMCPECAGLDPQAGIFPATKKSKD
jgi:DNA-directed RNA polymerase subunit RPC12/RpoP